LGASEEEDDGDLRRGDSEQDAYLGDRVPEELENHSETLAPSLPELPRYPNA